MPTDVAFGRRAEAPPSQLIRTRVLRSYARLLRVVLDETDEAVLVLDPAGEVVLSNRALELQLGPVPTRGYGEQNLHDLLNILGADADPATIEQLLGSRRATVTLRLQDGGALECRVRPLSIEGAGDHRLMMFREAGAPSAELTELRHRAFHDRLTGLPNRDLLIDRLEQALTRLGREGGAVAVIFIDLDGFKQINDQRGHAAGDHVLIEVAARLHDQLRQVDTVGRLGGDEFVIVCDGVADTQAVELICSRIQERVGAPIYVDGHALSVGASVGAVMERSAATDAAALLARADEYMYRAKRGGTQVEIADDRGAGGDDRHARLLDTVRETIAADQLELSYLPLVSLSYDRVVAVEALLRCSRPELAAIEPPELVELAEEAGAVSDLNRWVLHNAASAAAVLSSTTDSELTVIVNLSGAQLADPALGDLIRSAAAEARIEPRLLGFDIPERALAGGSPELEAYLSVLSDLGCQVFADDVTGPAVQVERLSELGFSGIKVAGSLLGALTDPPEASDVTRALIDRAHDLQLSVVGEQIADEQTLARARQLGCNGAQGFGLYGFPRPLAKIRPLID